MWALPLVLSWNQWRVFNNSPLSKITLDLYLLTIEVAMPTNLCPATLSNVDSLWPTIAYMFSFERLKICSINVIESLILFLGEMETRLYQFSATFVLGLEFRNANSRNEELLINVPCFPKFLYTLFKYFSTGSPSTCFHALLCRLFFSNFLLVHSLDQQWCKTRGSVAWNAKDVLLFNG